MAKTFQPLYTKNLDLILGDPSTGDNFKCQMQSVALTPDTNITRIKTACPEGQYANVDDPEWTLGLGYLYGNVIGSGTGAAALADFLLAHKGEQMPFLYRPLSGGAGYSGVVTIIAGEIGGEYGSYAAKTVNLPVTGQPAAVAALTV